MSHPIDIHITFPGLQVEEQGVEYGERSILMHRSSSTCVERFDERDYVSAILAETFRKSRHPNWQNRWVRAVYFNTGTFGHVSGESVARIISGIASVFPKVEDKGAHPSDKESDLIVRTRRIHNQRVFSTAKVKHSADWRPNSFSVVDAILLNPINLIGYNAAFQYSFLARVIITVFIVTHSTPARAEDQGIIPEPPFEEITQLDSEQEQLEALEEQLIRRIHSNYQGSVDQPDEPGKTIVTADPTLHPDAEIRKGVVSDELLYRSAHNTTSSNPSVSASLKGDDNDHVLQRGHYGQEIHNDSTSLPDLLEVNHQEAAQLGMELSQPSPTSTPQPTVSQRATIENKIERSSMRNESRKAKETIPSPPKKSKADEKFERELKEALRLEVEIGVAKKRLAALQQENDLLRTQISNERYGEFVETEKADSAEPATRESEMVPEEAAVGRYYLPSGSRYFMNQAQRRMYGTVVAEQAVVRTGPSRHDIRIMTLPRGTTVPVKYWRGGWTRIHTPSGVTAWINSDSLSVVVENQ